MGDCFHLHCQAGGSDRIGCTAGLHGWWSHLAWQWSLTLTGLWWLSRQCTLWGLAVCCCCFLEWKTWSLTLFCLMAILDIAFPSFIKGVFHWDGEIGLGTFPAPRFVWSLSAGILVVLSPQLDQSKTCLVPICILLCISRLRGVGCGTEVWSMVGGLAWTLWSQWVCPWRWFPERLLVPSSALCLALEDLSVLLLWGLVHRPWHFDTMKEASLFGTDENESGKFPGRIDYWNSGVWHPRGNICIMYSF